ncbi:nucleotide exchange factor GrpE [Streptomyces platensis]|uniref:nucleotide exchange factor GrpE n=1 Tax=Streptomyces platensis TaxID=58346 RepID=UPI001F3DBD29|nr:nucleotide exchange factor GrpE [Streptomyces platensis]MCF3147307.1 nucleotide exchange factor GrpE [Streptomyces platensis]
MNRPTNVHGLPHPPLALVGHGTAKSSEAGPPDATDPPEDRTEQGTGRPAGQDGSAGRAAPPEAVLHAELRERTADLQRLKAEYDNYRKRVHRDRLAVGEIAVVNVLSRLLPVLDSLAEATARDEVTGGFARIAEELRTELGTLGLQPFGAVGDPFDPLIHEALTYTPTDRLEQAICTEVLRLGYRVGDRLLRPAQVAVAGEPPAGA